MTTKLDIDSFFDFDDENLNQSKAHSTINQESTDEKHPNRSSSSTSGHFSNNTGDDKMSTRGSAREQSARSYTVYSRQSGSPSNSYQYSDSFDSEDSGQDTRQATPASRRRKKGSSSTVSSRAPQRSSKSYSSSTTNVIRSTTKKKAGGRKGTGTKSIGNTSRTTSLASVQHSPRTSSEVTQRMLSAKGHTISRLRNELEEIRLKYDDILSENKLLKQVQRRQERALTKFQDDEAELPQLLKKHSAELDSLNRRIRKYQQKDKEKERRGKEQHEQLLKTKDELRRLQDLATDKELKERGQLRRRVDQLEEELEEKNKRLMDLEKYTENIKKNHRRTEHQWRVKEMDIKNRLRDAEMQRDNFRIRLKEKEKELDVQNIYSHRISKAPSRLRAMSDTNQMRLSVSKSMSIEDLQSSVSPRQGGKPSPRRENKTHRSSSFSGNDARQEEKERETKPEPDTIYQKKEPEPEPETIHRDYELTAKGSETFEITKIEEERRASPKEVLVKDDHKPVESPRKEKTFEKKKEETKVEEEKEDEHLKILRMLDADVQNLETKKPVVAAATTKPVSESKSEENKGKVFGNTNSDNGGYKPTWLFGNKDNSEKQNQNEKKKEQLIKDLQNSDKSSKKEEEEKDFPFFGSPKVKQPPPQPSGVVNSVRDLHKYSNSAKSDKEKGEIVFNSNWKDDLGDTKLKSSTTPNNDYQKKKEILLQKMKSIDDSNSNGRTGSGNSQKDYKFTKPVENLHHGRPSHPEVNLSPKSSRKNQLNFSATNGRRASKDEIDVDEISFGSYAPSFTKPKETKQEKKTVPQFGEDSISGDSKERNVRSSFGGESIFSTSTKAKPVADSGGLPWETNSRASQRGAVFNANGKQNTLFATTPYSQQKSPFVAKPITTAVSDDIDDDIEEFIL